jgi:hypothetical protein
MLLFYLPLIIFEAMFEVNFYRRRVGGPWIE